MSAENELTDRSHYFIGSDPERWRTGVAGYARVRVRSVYPGIDVLHYGNSRRFEYDFIVGPHGDPRDIRIRFDRVQRVTIDTTGDLLLETARGTLRHSKPRMYQEREGRLEPVEGRFVRDGRVHGDRAAGVLSAIVLALLRPVQRFHLDDRSLANGRGVVSIRELSGRCR